MTITDPAFVLALPMSAIIYWLLPHQWLKASFLSLVSLALICYSDVRAAVVVVALTAYTWVAGVSIVRSEKKLYHVVGVAGLVVVLVAFKYLGLLSQTITSLEAFIHGLPVFRMEQLLPPLGISYITFKYISYLTDLRWGIVKNAGFVDLLCYGSLFTIFVAGPIERYERFAPQLKEPARRLELSDLGIAFQRIAVGMFKKLVIADWVGFFIEPVFKQPGNVSTTLYVLALCGYSVQIYMDFAGYSDIAIGASRLFGFKIMENFDWPYVQPGIGQFWRHWHISLSDWIRDYVFFPLSGLTRNWVWTLVMVPLIAMALCGLWHGPAWHFILWGSWHGAGIAVQQLWNVAKKKNRALRSFSAGRIVYGVSILLTFAFVTAGWIWFRG